MTNTAKDTEPGEPGRGRTTGRIGASLAPLAGRAFRLLWIGQTVSSAGDALVAIALVFAILRVGGTASDIGIIVAIQTVARVVFVLAGGVWADRLPRQLVMLVSDGLRAAVQATLAVLLISGKAQIWELGAGAAIFGAAQAFFGPAATGLLTETVRGEELPRANALLSFSANFFAIGGPAAAGVLVAVFGPGLVFAIDAATFVVSAISLGILKLPPRAVAERGSFWADLGTGWRELAARPWYWINIIAHALWNLAIAAYVVLGPVIAAHSLGGASAWGAISAAWAVGAVTGALLPLRLRFSRPLVAANLALTLGVLPMLALAVPLATWAIAIAAALCAAGVTFLNTVWNTTVQQLIPDQIRSRVDSYDWLISLVITPAGFAAVGPLAARVGNPTTLVGAALLMAVPVLVVILIPVIRSIRRNTDGSISLVTVERSAAAPSRD